MEKEIKEIRLPEAERWASATVRKQQRDAKAIIEETAQQIFSANAAEAIL